jgi:hypothetical protein
MHSLVRFIDKREERKSNKSREELKRKKRKSSLKNKIAFAQ